jgi:hypothetical protein
VRRVYEATVVRLQGGRAREAAGSAGWEEGGGMKCCPQLAAEAAGHDTAPAFFCQHMLLCCALVEWHAAQGALRQALLGSMEVRCCEGGGGGDDKGRGLMHGLQVVGQGGWWWHEMQLRTCGTRAWHCKRLYLLAQPLLFRISPSGLGAGRIRCLLLLCVRCHVAAS